MSCSNNVYCVFYYYHYLSFVLQQKKGITSSGVMMKTQSHAKAGGLYEGLLET